MSQAEATINAGSTRWSGADIQQLLLRGRAFIALIIVVAVFSYLSPTFLTRASIIIMSIHLTSKNNKKSHVEVKAN